MVRMSSRRKRESGQNISFTMIFESPMINCLRNLISSDMLPFLPYNKNSQEARVNVFTDWGRLLGSTVAFTLLLGTGRRPATVWSSNFNVIGSSIEVEGPVAQTAKRPPTGLDQTAKRLSCKKDQLVKRPITVGSLWFGQKYLELPKDQLNQSWTSPWLNRLPKSVQVQFNRFRVIKHLFLADIASCNKSLLCLPTKMAGKEVDRISNVLIFLRIE